eukprot:snap_masked-scaffold_53-processed-gene-0.27-mRNA-1 protein AED:1.00 eAED:1.00 QI:0/0/0/0/1/1/2/0/325
MTFNRSASFSINSKHFKITCLHAFKVTESPQKEQSFCVLAGQDNGSNFVWFDKKKQKDVQLQSTISKGGDGCSVIGSSYILNNTILYSGTTSGFFHLWDKVSVQSRAFRARLHHKRITGLHLISKHTVGSSLKLFTGSMDKSVKLWNISENKINLQASMLAHAKSLNGMMFNASETLMATYSDDHTIKIFDPRTVSSTVLRTLIGHRKEVKDLFWLQNQQSIFCSSDADGEILVYDVRVAKTGLVQRFWNPSRNRYCKRMISELPGECLISAQVEGLIEFYDLKIGRRTYKLNLGRAVSCLESGGDGRVYFGHKNGEITKWRLEE